MPEPAAKAPCFGHRAFLGPKLDEVEGAGAGAGSHLAFCSRSPNGEHRSTKALFSNEVASLGLPYLCIYMYLYISYYILSTYRSRSSESATISISHHVPARLEVGGLLGPAALRDHGHRPFGVGAEEALVEVALQADQPRAFEVQRVQRHLVRERQAALLAEADRAQVLEAKGKQGACKKARWKSVLDII